MGTITLSYSGSPNGNPVSVSSVAAIDDADAATLIAWATSNPTPPQLWNGSAIQAPQDVFNAISGWLSNEITQWVTVWQQQQAFAVVVGKIAPITIAPQAVAVPPVVNATAGQI